MLRRVFEAEILKLSLCGFLAFSDSGNKMNRSLCGRESAEPCWTASLKYNAWATAWLFKKAISGLAGKLLLTLSIISDQLTGVTS